MKNDEIRRANRKALPKFLLFAVGLVWVVGISAYCREAMRYAKAGNKIS